MSTRMHGEGFVPGCGLFTDLLLLVALCVLVLSCCYEVPGAMDKSVEHYREMNIARCTYRGDWVRSGFCAAVARDVRE